VYVTARPQAKAVIKGSNLTLIKPAASNICADGSGENAAAAK